MKAWASLGAAALLPVVTGWCDVSRAIPWKGDPTDPDDPSRIVYRPDPVVLVHGITSSRVRWSECASPRYGHVPIEILDELFAPYHAFEPAVRDSRERRVEADPRADPDHGVYDDFPDDPPGDGPGSVVIERPHAHTFHYGRHARRIPRGMTTERVMPAAETLDHVEWNAWQDESGGTTYDLDAPPVNNDPDHFLAWDDPAASAEDRRIAINERLLQLQSSYEFGPPASPIRPNVVLAGHSLAGLLMHYYMIREFRAADYQEGQGVVRRFISFASPHTGSHLGNLVMAWDEMTLTRHPVLHILFHVLLYRSLGFIPQAAAAVSLVDGREAGSTLDASVNYDFCPPGAFDPSPLMRQADNRLMEVFRDEPVPAGAEYVFNAFQFRRGIGESALRQDLGRLAAAATKVGRDALPTIMGDGIIPLDSQRGYHLGGGPCAYPNITPVSVAGYENHHVGWIASHGGSIERMCAWFYSLAGIPYASGLHPVGPGNWPGFDVQFPDSPVDATGRVHTDEPGIAAILLLGDVRDRPCPAFLPCLDISDLSDPADETRISSPPDAAYAGGSFFRSDDAGPLRIRALATCGVKGWSPNAVQAWGTPPHTTYHPYAGNEYLPANMIVVLAEATSPVDPSELPSPPQPLSGDSPVPLRFNTWRDRHDWANDPRRPQTCLTTFADPDTVTAYHALYEEDLGPPPSAQRLYVGGRAKNVAGLVGPRPFRHVSVRWIESPADIMLRISELEETVSSDPYRGDLLDPGDLCHCDYAEVWTLPFDDVVETKEGVSVYRLNAWPAGGIVEATDLFTGDPVGGIAVDPDVGAFVELTDPEGERSSFVRLRYEGAVGGTHPILWTDTALDRDIALDALTAEIVEGVAVETELAGEIRYRIEDLFRFCRFDGRVEPMSNVDLYLQQIFGVPEWLHPIGPETVLTDAHFEQFRYVVERLEPVGFPVTVGAYGDEGTSFLWRIENVDPPETYRMEPWAQATLTPGTYTVTFIVRSRVDGDTVHFLFSSLTGGCGAFEPVPSPVPDPGTEFRMIGRVGCWYFPPQP